jgi:U3 small nucleolar RNA-associated protein 15
MAAEVRPVQQVRLPSKPSALTPEQTYWRSFRSPKNIASPSNQAVTHVSQPTFPSNTSTSSSDFFVVTTGARVQLYAHKTGKLAKTISRFDDTAYSGELRFDGRVLAAGDESGAIQVFDVGSRAILKTWKESKQPTRAIRWHPTEPTALMSCGDDTAVRVWDLPSEKPEITLRGHTDYVRTGAYIPGSNLLVSGSYDATIKLWDPRASAAVMTFTHTAGIESVLPMSDAQTVLAAAGPSIAVLDVVAGKTRDVLTNHQKTVTSLCLASHGSRLVSGALDGHMKVFETTGWNVVAGSKYPSPILSLCVVASGSERDDKHIAVGTSAGVLSIKTRLSGEQKVKERERQKEMDALLAGKIAEYDAKQAKKRGRGWEKRFRGRDYEGEEADIIVEGNDRTKPKKLKPWEQNLHKGRYFDALDIVLRGKDRMTIFTLLNHLRYRSALHTALEGRNETTLQPIINWVYKNISSANERFVNLCIEVSMTIMELYAKHLTESPQLEKDVTRLRKRVLDEVERAKQASETMGMLGLVCPGVDEP